MSTKKPVKKTATKKPTAKKPTAKAKAKKYTAKKATPKKSATKAASKEATSTKTKAKKSTTNTKRGGSRASPETSAKSANKMPSHEPSSYKAINTFTKMGKICCKCQRQVKEYYSLKNGRYMCYDCYINEKNQISMIYNNGLNEANNRRNNILNNIRDIEMQINIKTSTPEYIRYWNDDLTGVCPPVYYEVSALRSRKGELQEELKRIRSVNDPFLPLRAEAIDSAVYHKEE